MHIHTFTCMHIYIYIHVCSHIGSCRKRTRSARPSTCRPHREAASTCTHTNMVHMHIHTFTCIYIHLHVCIHKYIHIHTQVPVESVREVLVQVPVDRIVEKNVEIIKEIPVDRVCAICMYVCVCVCAHVLY